MESYWYILKVLPGKERQLNEQFNQQITLGRVKNIKRFICPTENEFVSYRNKKVLREKVIYSGYLYFESQKLLNEDELKEISSKQNIMGMMGDRLPMLMRKNDVEKIIKDEMLEEHMVSKKLKFENGDNIRIIDGPFSSFEGVISTIDGDKVDVEVKIFGRNTAVSLNLNQIEKYS